MELELEGENFKPIKDERLSENYLIGELGSVYSIKSVIKMKPYVHSNGYYRINFRYEDKVLTKYLHRLVAEVWVPNPNNYTIIDHLNMDKLDPRASNLEWVTQKSNIERMLDKTGGKRLVSNEIAAAIAKKGKYDTYKKMAEDYGINVSLVKRIILGYNYTACIDENTHMIEREEHITKIANIKRLGKYSTYAKIAEDFDIDKQIVGAVLRGEIFKEV